MVRILDLDKCERCGEDIATVELHFTNSDIFVKICKDCAIELMHDLMYNYPDE